VQVLNEKKSNAHLKWTWKGEEERRFGERLKLQDIVRISAAYLRRELHAKRRLFSTTADQLIRQTITGSRLAHGAGIKSD